MKIESIIATQVEAIELAMHIAYDRGWNDAMETVAVGLKEFAHINGVPAIIKALEDHVREVKETMA